MNQVEFLLRLSENAQESGDEIAHRHNAERTAHVKQLLELEKMISLAKQNIDGELARWGVSKAPQGQLPHNRPQAQEPVPRVVQKGPAAQ